MSLINGKFLIGNSVTGSAIRLDNDQYLRARNAANTSDVNILKVNSSNEIEFTAIPIVSGLGALALDSDVVALYSSVSTLQSDVSTLQGLQSSYLLLDGTRSMTGALNMNSHQINNVTDPTSAQDAATKNYVDSQTSGISNKANRNLDNLQAATDTNTGYIFYSNVTFSRGAGTNVILRGKAYVPGEASGNVLLFSGAVQGGATLTSGSVQIYSGIINGAGSGFTGSVSLYSGPTDTGSSGDASVNSGISNTGNTGAVEVRSGYTGGSGNTGSAIFGTGFVFSGQSGNTSLISGAAAGGGISGSVTVKTGDSLSGTGTSGTLLVTSGASNGVSGNAQFSSGVSVNSSSGNVLFCSGNSTTDSGYVGLFTGDTSAGSSGFVDVRSGNSSGVTGGVYIHSGESSTTTSGEISIYTGQVVGSGNRGTGSLYLSTGIADTGKTGDILIFTGLTAGETGKIEMKSGNASGSSNTGDVTVGTGDANSGNSGNVYITCGSSTSGTVGKVLINTYIDMSLKKITNMADPTQPQDAATKAYVDAQVGGGGNTPIKQTYNVTGPILVNTNITLTQSCVASSMLANITTGPILEEGVDYTVSGTTMTLLAASPVIALLASGDVISLQYLY